MEPEITLQQSALKEPPGALGPNQCACADLAKHRVMVVVPAYNEERFIGSVVLKIRRFEVQVIVVDDGSQDNTAHLAELAGADVVRMAYNQGKAAALNAGFERARQFDPDVIVILDADDQHRSEELPAIIAPVLEGRSDLVIGSRYLQNTSNTPGVRRLGHRLFNLATSVTSGTSCTDSQSGFRAFSRRAYGCSQFLARGFAVESEMQFQAHEHNLKVCEVPITIRYQDRPKRSAFQHGLHVLSGIIKLTGQYRPLLFFSVPGFFLLALGIAWGLYVVERYVHVGELAVGCAMICVLLCVFGLVMLSTGITLHSMRGLLVDFLQAQRKGG